METQNISRHDFFRLMGANLGAILLTHYATSCTAKDNGNPSPIAQDVDFTLQLADKGNENLRVKGGYVVANNIIVAQTKEGKFIAVSANCTCAEAGTQLTYKSSENQFYCSLHLSRYDSDGNVVMGPATKSLVQYQTSVDDKSNSIRIVSKK